MRSVIILAGALALAGCGDQGAGDADPGDLMAGADTSDQALDSSDTASNSSDGEPVSMEEAARRAEGIVKPQPGQYRATVEVLDVSLPGAPPQVREQIRQMQSAGARTREYCLTPEQAEKGFEEMVRQANTDDSCSFSKFEAEGGNIDAVMTCSRAGQGSGRMTMQGSGTRTSSDMTMTMTVDAPNGTQMNMKMRSQQQRIGDC